MPCCCARLYWQKRCVRWPAADEDCTAQRVGSPSGQLKCTDRSWYVYAHWSSGRRNAVASSCILKRCERRGDAMYNRRLFIRQPARGKKIKLGTQRCRNR